LKTHSYIRRAVIRNGIAGSESRRCVSNSTVLTGTSPSGSQIVDFIGYGEANASENGLRLL
jgi:hypothetical protein